MVFKMVFERYYSRFADLSCAPRTVSPVTKYKILAIFLKTVLLFFERLIDLHPFIESGLFR